MKRLFWLGVGVAAGVALSRKAKETARQATPAGIAANLGDALQELAGAIGAFGADVRAGMTEREEELSDVVEQRSGMRATGSRHALDARPEQAPRARRGTDARARRANG